MGHAPTKPVDKLTGEGKALVEEFADKEGKNIEVYTTYAMAAAQVALDAICRSDGSREDIVAKLFETNLPDSVVGRDHVQRGRRHRGRRRVRLQGHGWQVAVADGEVGLGLARTTRQSRGPALSSAPRHTMATQEAAAEGPVARPRRSTSDWLRLVFGLLLVGGFGWWLIGKAIEEPERFVEVTLIGFTNGQVYALVALGYTLVYGIIELINFAHGDNFMLATFQTQSMVRDGSFQIPLLFGTIAIPLGTQVTVDDSTAQKIYSITLIVLLTMIFCAASTSRSSGSDTSRCATSRDWRR